MRLRREDHTGRDIVFTSVAEMENGINIAKNLGPEDFVGAVAIFSTDEYKRYGVISGVNYIPAEPDVIGFSCTDAGEIASFSYTRSTGHLTVTVTAPSEDGTGPM